MSCVVPVGKSQKVNRVGNQVFANEKPKCGMTDFGSHGGFHSDQTHHTKPEQWSYEIDIRYLTSRCFFL